MQRKASLLALAISLVAALLLLWMLGRPLGATRSVVVVTRDVAPGQPIVRPMLDFRDLPEAFVEERHIPAESVERALGMRATASVASGATLLWTDLDTARAGKAVSGLVQVGMRALALPGAGAEHWLQPGDRVDVLFTPRVPDDGSPDEQASVVLLENTLVLAVGAEDKDAEVTLSVNPREALRIVHTQGRGALRLTLRNPHDVAVAEVFDDPRGAP
ncbi:MAG TPA: Flp pilus assembly protein CpaB [Polyangiales bacterium]|nr:Flp pilus assembly protein CpaB [Polyangiales bacterium]